MEIFGVNILDYVTNPINGVIGASTGIIFYQIYKIIYAKAKPDQYILKLYSLCDDIVLELDNRFIDKFLPEKVKTDLQNKIIKILDQRVLEIEKLKQKIND
jgi:hypothetical protein